MPSLEHNIPFNRCKCTDFYEYTTKPRSFLDFFTTDRNDRFPNPFLYSSTNEILTQSYT